MTGSESAAPARVAAHTGARAMVPAGALVGALVLGGCTSSDQAGFGLPTVAPGSIAGERSDLTGTMHVESNGCFTLDVGDGVHRWLVFPGGRDDGDGAILAGGARVTEGSVLTGTGVLTDASALPGWTSESSYFQSFGTYCSADRTGIAVFDDVDATG